MSADISASSAPPSPHNPEDRLLKVGGITPFTATDYPGKLAAVIFVQGCPWRCDYCHNPHLQLRTIDSPQPWTQVLALLKRRVGLIDGVVFCGGEPTTDPGLHDAILEVRELGFAVGLHTAGAYPKRLASVLPLLDWIGFDIKAPFAQYDRITGVADSGRHARLALEAILASGVDYECRTTIHPALLPEAVIIEMAEMLAHMGVRNYALQVFRAQGCRDNLLNAVGTAGYPSEAVVERVKGLFSGFVLRRGE